MKLKSIYNWAAILVLAVMTVDCTEMNDLHQEYLDRGEIIYAARVDSIFARPGYKREQLDIYFSSQRIDKAIVYWNLLQDSLQINPMPAPDGNVFEVNIPNLDEGDITFKFVTLDKYGNRSLPTEVVGKVYGDTYKQSIQTRGMKNALMVNGVVVVSIGSIQEGMLSTTVKYQQADGPEKEIVIDNNSTTLSLENPSFPVTLSYFSTYLPSEAAIDSMKSETITKSFVVEAKMSKSGMSIAEFSSEEPKESNWGPPIQGSADAVIDDDLSTFWHSAWDLSQPPYPHWFVVDLGRTVDKLSGIDVYRRQGNGNGQTKHRIEYSLDGTTWTEYGTFPMDASIDQAQRFNPTSPVKARYLRYTALEGSQFYAFLAEIDFYEQL